MLDQVSEVYLWKEFGLIVGDDRLCIQFWFNLGKRLDVGSNVYFLFFFFWKGFDFNLRIVNQLKQ